MRHVVSLALLAVLGWSGPGRAGMVSERWGGAGAAVSHPGTLKIVPGDGGDCLQFDLSALPAGARVYRASLSWFSAGAEQPAKPVRVFPAERREADGKPAAGGRPLQLEAPWFRSLDATEAVRQWAAHPEKNCGFLVASAEGLEAGKAFLEVRYEGAGSKVPPQVDGLIAVHANGQTFLTWKEIPEFRPAADEVVWIDGFKGVMPTGTAKGPGKDAQGRSFIPAVTVKTLRRLQGVAVRETPGPAQQMVPTQRVREIPAVRYRVYRSAERITAENLHAAELCGEAEPFSPYVDLKTYWCVCEGEYYRQHENPDALIPTLCVGEGRPVPPGEDYFVHTPPAAGRCYYAVTAVADGTENAAQVGEANSLAEPVEEKPALPRPVFQHAGPNRYTPDSIENWYCYWVAPPLANLPNNRPMRIGVSVPNKFARPGPMVIKGGDSWGWFYGFGRASPTNIELLLGTDCSGSGGLCYNSGRGTLKSFGECEVGFFSERYNLALIDWALGKWDIDRTRLSGGEMNFSLRHPELFRYVELGPFSLNFDWKWDPCGWYLPRSLGPMEETRTADGQRAWDIFSIQLFLARDPGRDIPFLGCFFTQPKDANHGVEYGWQDDPRGLAALRDAREPYAANWGGVSVSPELRRHLAELRWDKTIPAFSNCFLDNNPGNGDPDDGDPVGQINGYLVWEYADIVDRPDRWEMTVSLTKDAPKDSCRVDVTPRQCGAFKAKAGEKFGFTCTALAGDGAAQAGDLAADRWGLVTVRQITVTKGRQRIVIARK